MRTSIIRIISQTDHQTDRQTDGLGDKPVPRVLTLYWLRTMH